MCVRDEATNRHLYENQTGIRRGRTRTENPRRDPNAHAISRLVDGDIFRRRQVRRGTPTGDTPTRALISEKDGAAGSTNLACNAATRRAPKIGHF